jgi:hypothetical protein
MFFTGATGLEPATSGVTGRQGATGYSRLQPGITGYRKRLVVVRTGCDRLRPAATRQGLCSRCVVALVADQATRLRTAMRAAAGARFIGEIRRRVVDELS